MIRATKIDKKLIFSKRTRVLLPYALSFCSAKCDDVSIACHSLQKGVN